MAQYTVVPGRGRVRIDNSFCGCVGYSNGSSNDNYHRESLYERTKRQVYATGNKWAIENFHATHD